jgi:hypothetical protein
MPLGLLGKHGLATQCNVISSIILNFFKNNYVRFAHSLIIGVNLKVLVVYHKVGFNGF